MAMAVMVIVRMECALIPKFACRNGANEKQQVRPCQPNQAWRRDPPLAVSQI
jgi:hypothetical protein